MKMKNKRRLGKAAERNQRDITGTGDRMRHHQNFRQQVEWEAKYNWKLAVSYLGERDFRAENMSSGYQSRISPLPRAKREHETKRNLIEGTFRLPHLAEAKKTTTQLPCKVTAKRRKKELTLSGTWKKLWQGETDWNVCEEVCVPCRTAAAWQNSSTSDNPELCHSSVRTEPNAARHTFFERPTQFQQVQLWPTRIVSGHRRATFPTADRMCLSIRRVRRPANRLPAGSATSESYFRRNDLQQHFQHCAAQTTLLSRIWPWQKKSKDFVLHF